MRLALAAAFALLAGPAFAQACAEHDDVTTVLLHRYGETLQNIGLGADGRMVEIYASPASGSWTIISVTPGGIACMVAAGEMWQAAWPAPVGEPL